MSYVAQNAKLRRNQFFVLQTTQTGNLRKMVAGHFEANTIFGLGQESFLLTIVDKTNEDVAKVEFILNSRGRESLGFKSSNQVMFEHLMVA